jgi:hypothetical protein
MNQMVTQRRMAVAEDRAKLAVEIRKLVKDIAVNSVKLGLKLIDARDTFPTTNKGPNKHRGRPGWRQWVKDEAGLSVSTVNILIRVATKFGSNSTLSNWKVSGRVLKLLSSPNVSNSTRLEVVGRIEKGETISEKEAKAIVAKVNEGRGITKKEIGKVSSFYGTDRQLPKPADARKQARDSGLLVLASDGYYYTPATDDQIKMGERQRHLVFGMRRAVEMLASIEMTPHQFIDFAPDYILPTEEEDRKNVRAAAKWLNAFATAWEIKADIIEQQIQQRAEALKLKQQQKILEG